MKNIAIVLAGGYGSFNGPNRQKISKVTAHINGKPMIRQIVETVQSTGMFGHTYVVVNTTYGDQIKHALEGLNNLYFPTQTKRLGSAGAVQLALKELKHHTQALIVYGDNPLWGKDTYAKVMESHIRSGAVLTVTTIPLVKGAPIERYGRTFYHNGKLVGTLDDPSAPLPRHYTLADKVNPSLYAANTAWMIRRIPKIKPSDKGDGCPPERLMQSLIAMAWRRNHQVNEVSKSDHYEALGVNTLQELREVRQIHATLMG